MSSNYNLEACPVYAPFLSLGGAAIAMVLASLGASYGTSRSGTGLIGLGLFKEEAMMKCIIPVVMSGIVAVYGLVVAVIISNKLDPRVPISLSKASADLAAGLSAGLTGVASGYAIGYVGDLSSRSYYLQPKIFTGTIIILIFGEVLGLYGLIVAIILSTQATSNCN